MQNNLKSFYFVGLWDDLDVNLTLFSKLDGFILVHMDNPLLFFILGRFWSRYLHFAEDGAERAQWMRVKSEI